MEIGIWFGLLILFGILEAVTVSVVSIWFMAGSLAAILAALGAVEFWFAFAQSSLEEEIQGKVDERALFIATKSGHTALRILNGLLFAGAMLALLGYGFTKDGLWMAVALTLCGVVIAMFLVLLAVNCWYEKKY